MNNFCVFAEYTALKMGTPVIFKISLTDGSSQKLTLSHGLPALADDLMVEVKKQCGLEGNFRLQFMNSIFGNEFLNLTSISELEDKGTLKVTDMTRPTTMQQDDERFTVCNPVLKPQAFGLSSVSDSSSLSGGTVDTNIWSSN